VCDVLLSYIINMAMKKSYLVEALEVLQDRAHFLKRLNEDSYRGNIVLAQILLIFIFTFFYGVIMGSYNSFEQAVSTGLKLWLLFMLTLLICFPSFYIVQLILGSKIKIGQLVIILLAGFVMVSVTLLAFAPIVLFFQLSGDNYHFLQLLHVFVFGFSGVFGMKVVLDALTALFEGQNIYPKVGLTVFKIWVIIFAFVGMQLSWNMRPFLGNKNMDFQLFRTETKGNFYGAVFSSVGNLLGVNSGNKSSGNPKNDELENYDNKNINDLDLKKVDSLKQSKFNDSKVETDN
ncbi:MAG: hypothetical protein AAGI07_03400, partial [Bacteroidota bacterium]